MNIASWIQLRRISTALNIHLFRRSCREPLPWTSIQALRLCTLSPHPSLNVIWRMPIIEPDEICWRKQLRVSVLERAAWTHTALNANYQRTNTVPLVLQICRWLHTHGPIISVALSVTPGFEYAMFARLINAFNPSWNNCQIG
jgi:hypothetical protein